MTTTTVPASTPVAAPGLPPMQGQVLAVLWDDPYPATTANIAARLGLPSAGRVRQAADQLRAAGLVTVIRAGGCNHYLPALARDDYLAALITAALDQAGDPAAVLRTALRTSPAPSPSPIPASWPTAARASAAPSTATSSPVR